MVWQAREGGRVRVRCCLAGYLLAVSRVLVASRAHACPWRSITRSFNPLALTCLLPGSQIKNRLVTNVEKRAISHPLTGLPLSEVSPWQRGRGSSWARVRQPSRGGGSSAASPLTPPFPCFSCLNLQQLPNKSLTLVKASTMASHAQRSLGGVLDPLRLTTSSIALTPPRSLWSRGSPLVDQQGGKQSKLSPEQLSDLQKLTYCQSLSSGGVLPTP